MPYNFIKHLLSTTDIKRRIKKKYFEKINSLRRKQGYKPLTKDEFDMEFKQKKMKDGFLDFGDLDVDSQINFLDNLHPYQI